uniref:Orf8 n=1 Tax=Escherichia coli TaxID=562 RepID=Q79EA5_ECOLX|nr:Orf8 [Escherichia coli]
MDALPNPKRVKITLRFSRKILNAIFPMIPNPLADTTSRREPKSYCSVNVMNTFIWIRFSGDMLPDGGINRR